MAWEKRLTILMVLFALMLCKASLAESRKADSITLKRALQLAKEQNESYRVSEERLKQAGLARERAWAVLLPTLAAGGTFTHSNKEIGFSGRVIQRQDYFAGSASLSLTLFKGPSIPGVVRSYKQVEAASQQTVWQRNALDFEVARAYFAALAAENLVEAARRSLVTAEEQLTATQARRSAGEVLGLDETRARIEVVSSQGGLERFQNARDGAMDYLAFLIGMEPPLSIAHHEVRLPLGGADEKLGPVLKKRPDARSASLQVEALQSAVTGSWMDFLPELSVTGNYRLTQNTGWSGDIGSWNIILSLDWLLFDGGVRTVAVRERSSQLLEAKLQRQYLERSIRREVRQALRDLKSAETTLRTAEEKLRLAKESQNMVMTRYRAGLATSLEVVEASDALKQSEVLVVSEELNLSLTKLELLLSLGLTPLGEEIVSP